MANDLNQCTFIGRLGRDPEARTFPSGDMVCNFTIGVGEQWKDKNTGEKKESTEWVSVVAGGKLGEICAQYLQKGAQVMITGKMKTRKWEKDGVTRYATEIRADSMQMLGGKPSGNEGYSDNQGQPRQAAPQRQAPQAPPPQRASGGFSDMDDDCPFADPLRRSSALHLSM